MTDTRHQPYIMQDPPQSDDPADFRDYLGNEFRKIELAQNGVDLDVETRWGSIPVSIEIAKAAGINDPTFAQIVTDGAGSNGIYVNKFSSVVENELFITIDMPHDYKEGSILKPAIHWTTEVTASASEMVVWGLEIWNSNTNEDFPANSRLIEITATCYPTPLHNIYHDFPVITASSATIDHLIICRFYRDPTVGGDNFGGNAAALDIVFRYEKDAHGSTTENNK